MKCAWGTRYGTLVCCTVAALLAAGCGGHAVKENYYTLAGPQAPLAVSNAELSVYVGPVVVPDAVDRQAMVLRTSPTQVEISDAHRWAEPLKSAIPRALAETLMRELGTPRVTAARLGSAQVVDYRVAVEVQRFDSSVDQGASLDALWTVTPAKGPARSGRTTITEATQTPDPAGIVAAHSRALERMGKEIAGAIRR
jgi:uncharacterized lipoprotein YmbA